MVTYAGPLQSGNGQVERLAADLDTSTSTKEYTRRCWLEERRLPSFAI